MFSPYYAAANAKAPADAENHCAINIVLYEKRHSLWSMTERRKHALHRSSNHLQIGPSLLQWHGGGLSAEIEEMTVPIPQRLHGKIRLLPQAIQWESFSLDAAGRHRWRPIAPQARIEVEFTKPEIRWSGHAYFDTNDGAAPLAEDFSAWHWCRCNDGTILYDARRRDDTDLSLALKFNANGEVAHFAPPPEQALPDTFWRIKRSTRADAGTAPRVVKTLEDAPFYARSMIESRIDGQNGIAVHESLSLDRFSKPWVRMLLPFRMPRL